MTDIVRGLPHPADFPPPPSAADRARWAEADGRPGRRAWRGCDRDMAAEGVDAYFGVRPEHIALPDRLRRSRTARIESPATRVASWSPPTRSCCWRTAATGCRPSPRRRTPGSRPRPTTWRRSGRRSLGSVGAKRVAVEAALVSHQLWQELAARRAGRGAGGGGRLGRSRSGREGAERDRTHPGGLRRRATGPGIDPAPHQARADGARSGPGARVGDADGRRRRTGLRGRLPGRPQRGAAARLAIEPRRSASARFCCSTSGRWSTAIAAT